jgi:NTP pyrophosphatase (non-canonical NTP hydrolase)
MSKYRSLQKDVLGWARDKDLLKIENHKSQALKMVSEVGELCDAIAKNDNEETIDAIGDTLVTLIILANQLGLDEVDCLESAYGVIRNRKGKTVNGTFIKH